MRSTIPGILVLLFLLCAQAAHAADPQTYRVNIASTGNDAMDDILHESSDLVSLRDAAPVSPFGLIARARAEVDRLKTVMESFGYYQSLVTIKIQGLSLDDGTLVDVLSALPKKGEAVVAVGFELGPLYHLRNVTVDGTIPDSAKGAFSLQSGAPAIAADVVGAGLRLLTQLEEHGYAFAKVDPPVAYEDRMEPVLDVGFHVEAGQQVNVGEIRFQGLKLVHEEFVRRRLRLRSGQQYSASSVEAARRDLLDLGLFNAVNVKLGTTVDSTGGVPVTFRVRERSRRTINVNGAYSTDLGGSGGIAWSNRNTFGNGERLSVSASVINLGGHASTAVGYDTHVALLLPDFGHRDQSLQFSLGALNQSLQAYDQEAITSGVTLTRKLSSVWTASVGLTTSNERITQYEVADEPGVNYKYVLLAMPLVIGYDSTNLAAPLDDPLHGMRDSLSITPTQSFGNPNATFVITQVKLAAYFDLEALGFGKPGRTVLAARALGGGAQGAGEFSLPPDQRFYAGGSGTIRGYRYQAVGPQFPNGNPQGGTSIVAGSLELRQRFGKAFGGAVFVDAGQVGLDSGATNGLAAAAGTQTTGLELGKQLQVGVGIGLRYYTPIGPIRLDFAVPTKHYSADDDPYELYIGLGQAF
jgi:translocation and assembly module TamA